MNSIKNWFPFYAADWLTAIDLRFCNLELRGLLIELMAISWHSDSPGIITRNIDALAAFIQVDSSKLKKMLALLEQNHLIEYDGETITIKRLQEIAREQHKKHKQKVNAGRKGGYSKAQNNDTSSTALADGNFCSSRSLAIEKNREEKNREDKSETRAREEAPPPDLNIGTYKGEVLLMWKQLEDLAPRRITKSEKARMVPALSRMMKDIGTKQAFLKVWSKAMKHDNASKWLGHPDWLEKDFGQFLPKKVQTAIPAESLILRKEGKRDFAKMFKDKQAKEAYIASHKLKVVAGFGDAAVYEVAE